jgi:mono/diheme cytochrome c family protein
MPRSSAYPLSFFAALIVSLLSLVSPAALAQDAARISSQPTLSGGFKFAEQSGEELYANVCQGCHMPDGNGAIGAGTYPSIASNKALEASGYSLHVVVNGQRAMPPFGDMMNDGQIAAVVNYVRTHFGNAYKDAVTPEDVKVVRP